MRYLLISDIHSNLPALERVLEDAPLFDKIWCLGDLVGYGPDPNACIERIRALPHTCLMGNHDWAALGKNQDREFNPDARAAIQWTRNQLTPANRAYLESLPTIVEEDGFTLTHGSPRDPIWEYILYPSVARLSFAHFQTQVCFVGHTHLPRIFRLHNGEQGSLCEEIVPPLNQPIELGEERMIVNPGSVGQPRDGDARASYAVLDTEARTLEYRRVSYPIEETQQRMEELGLPYRLIARIAYGW